MTTALVNTVGTANCSQRQAFKQLEDNTEHITKYNAGYNNKLRSHYYSPVGRMA